MHLSEGLWLGLTQTEPARDNCCAGCSGALWCLVVWLLGHLHRMLKVALRQPLLSDPAATQTVSGMGNLKCAGVHYLEQVMCDTAMMPSVGKELSHLLPFKMPEVTFPEQCKQSH